MNQQYELTYEKTLVLKTIAVVLMFIHHLFIPMHNVTLSDYQSIWTVNQIPIELVVAYFGKICVFMFLFISGYGFYKKEVSYREAGRKLILFYLHFWTIFLLFGLIGFGLNRVDFGDYSWNQWLLTLAGVQLTFVKEWWFIRLYAVLLLLAPFVIRLAKRGTWREVGLMSLCLWLLQLYTPNEWLDEFLYHQIYFVIGILFAKEQVFQKLSNISLMRNRWVNLGFLMLMAIFHFWIKNEIDNTRPLYHAIWLGIQCASLVCMTNLLFSIHWKENNKLCQLIGKHSMTLWLIHPFFMFYYFHDFTYCFTYSILIFIVVFILNVGLSVLIDGVIFHVIKKRIP